MVSQRLFRSSPIQGVSLFDLPMEYRSWKVNNNDPLPIGKQIENVFADALDSSNRYSVLAKGLQIQEKGITLGELDFIIKDQVENVIFHLELVHKFYIYDQRQGETVLSRWTGPNYHDKLEYKLQKLRDHQFPLLYHDCTAPYLKALGLEASDLDQRLCFNAELYVPLGQSKKDLGPIEEKSIRGDYCSFEEFELQIDQGFFFHHCDKLQWIQNEQTCDQWTDAQTCLSSLKSKANDGRAQMVWIKKDEVIHRQFILFKDSPN